MRPKPVHLYALVLAFSAAILYGATYQQFRFFNLDAPLVPTDAIHYVQMARGNFDFEDHHRYRWLTPTAVRLVLPIVEGAVQDKALADKLSFYFVNFAFSLGTCVALFARLQAMGFSVLLSLLGVCAFAVAGLPRSLPQRRWWTRHIFVLSRPCSILSLREST